MKIYVVVAGPSQMHRYGEIFDAAIAQLAERFICNELVPDSTSGCGSNLNLCKYDYETLLDILDSK